jgi:hypothetical protein
MERMFLRAARELPAVPSEVARSSYGVLYLKWACPCPEIEALWVSVQPTEITLSCKVTHTHFSRTRYLKDRLTSLALKRRIVRDAIREAALFLCGQVSVTISYTDTGAKQSSGWCKMEQLSSSLAYSRKVFGSGITQQAWSWNGPVNQSG